MKIEEVENFIKLAKDYQVAELEYENQGERISVKFVNDNIGLVQHSTLSKQQEVQTQEQIAPQENKNLFEIKSPFVGTYYSSPAPGKPAYIKTGDKINPGQALCVLEAMKIMNELESEVSGVIEEICVENEQLVEFGQVLFRVRL